MGQGWIALKPEYCIREKQLVRSQNRLSYERGWVKRERRGREVGTGMESRGGESEGHGRERGRNYRKKLIAQSLWGGWDHPNTSVTISPSSPVRKSVWEQLAWACGVCVCVCEGGGAMWVLWEVRGRSWGSTHLLSVQGPPLLADIWPHTDHSYLQTGRRRGGERCDLWATKIKSHSLASFFASYCFLNSFLLHTSLILLFYPFLFFIVLILHYI